MEIVFGSWGNEQTQALRRIKGNRKDCLPFRRPVDAELTMRMRASGYEVESDTTTKKDRQ